MTEPTKNMWAELRKPFPKESVGKIPKGGAQLDYVGHAQVTDRLNTVVGAENWSLEPLSFNPDGTPVITANSTNAVMWARLTVMGASKLCVGTVKKTAYELEKEIIGDALRNGAMRFGVALDLWSKDELESQITPGPHPLPEINYDKSPEEPSRQITDEPITPTSMEKVKLRLRAKNLTGVKATEFVNFIIDKPAPTTEADAQQILAALESK